MNKATRKNIIKEIKSILKTHNINYAISLNSNQCYSQAPDNYIYLGFNSPEFKTRDSMLTALFHEMAHLINYQNNKYYQYHENKLTNKAIVYAIRFGLRAEQHTDQIGEKLMKAYDPKTNFKHTYNRPEMKIRYKEEYLTKLIKLMN
jgi:predicted SprT family Zn-dependent metalloprotease